ncbi:hypothetical protein L198_01938 [Cryptococcus wingfieldii CBS 7118]|uniref:Uncharacterized protein n=1 Tax=Cryptococcus wingfieldii CBS 7118 TaxID=1295528 RepID=A0A1E3JYG3_9TREE|nr:hypothetical protein L198_01938 [Cryptococcus wingfieldii CBS 7118]ODO05247.1 hypothetical protein L198_01938 [Cryptococcus wingfieldii CBS 7118]
MHDTRRSSHSTYTRDWKKSVQQGGGMAKNKDHPYSHDESGRRESNETYIPQPPKKSFFQRIFGCTCFELDVHQDPVRRYRPTAESTQQSPPPPSYTHADPFPIAPLGSNHRATDSTASVSTTLSGPALSNLLFIPRQEDEAFKTYAPPNGSFAGGTTGGAGAGGG